LKEGSGTFLSKKETIRFRQFLIKNLFLIRGRFLHLDDDYFLNATVGNWNLKKNKISD
jgi:hypothetical protein